MGTIPRTNGARTHLGRMCGEAMEITESIWGQTQQVKNSIAGTVAIQGLKDYYSALAITDDRLNVIYHTKGIDKAMKSELDDNSFKAPDDYLPFQAAAAEIIAWCEANLPQGDPPDNAIEGDKFGTREIILLTMTTSQTTGLTPLLDALIAAVDA